MPRRVVDGVVSETMRRPVWCLVERSLHRSGVLQELIALLRSQALDVALLAGELTPESASAPARFASVGDVCASLGVSPADVVFVSGDLANDASDFAPSGARQVELAPTAAPRRGILWLSSVDELQRWFGEHGSYPSGSTYHEV
jgi:hypothetical protein